MALRYDERSWFRGFLKTTLGFRKMDELRRIARDPLRLAIIVDEFAAARDAADEEENERDPAQDAATTKRSPSPLEAGPDEVVEGPDCLERLRPRLTEVQRQVLDLKRMGLTDKAVAAKLAMRRETVNRHLRSIKKIASTRNL